MKYQASRPQFFSMGGWGVVGCWVVGWVMVGVGGGGVSGGGGAEWWRGGGWCD